MTKEELVARAANDAGITKKAAASVVNAILEGITDALASGDKVTLVGFGTFLPTQRKARTGRNPQTGGTLRIPAKTVPKFRPGKKLRNAVA
ncbi:MAG TPA: HU family DNA-binding protein [Candidatus Latescibacteria bacterium]|nr:HU family DNA-binding protein [Candidatus Latescibacterota bacterium]